MEFETSTSTSTKTKTKTNSPAVSAGGGDGDMSTSNIFQSFSEQNKKMLLIPCFKQLIMLLIGTKIDTQPLTVERISLLKVLRQLNPNNFVWIPGRESMRIFNTKLKILQKKNQYQSPNFEFDWDKLTPEELQLKLDIQTHLRWKSGDEVEFKLENCQNLDFVRVAKLFQEHSSSSRILSLGLSKI
ncbi:unnamed protein product [Ambrosiozyma monospora]|uniref:Unnamed protein product n=1 Tax=Ambrosiozyma monospora TaxID=43982 RepID=A0ACB5TXP2_AMBMO|nr:unnamed protein product [Ambrosiozyma monospora]